MIDSLYYPSRKIPGRCENSFVNYRTNALWFNEANYERIELTHCSPRPSPSDLYTGQLSSLHQTYLSNLPSSTNWLFSHCHPSRLIAMSVVIKSIQQTTGLTSTMSSLAGSLRYVNQFQKLLSPSNVCGNCRI